MIDLQLLGGLAIDGPELPQSARARRRHPLALLALVAAAAPQAVGRDKIMAFLWPESDMERASNSLRQTLFWLRRDLGADVFVPESATGLRLNADRVKVDLWAFRESMERGAPEEAVQIYGGPFLEGFRIPGVLEFSRWAESERGRMERQHAAALDALGRQAEEEGRYEDAVAWRRRQAAADPYSSRVALSLLRALTAAGDRPAALEYASTYESLVRLHLEAQPDPAVTEFVETLRRDSASLEPGGRAAVGWRRPVESKTSPKEMTRAADMPAGEVTAVRRGERIGMPPRTWLATAAALAAMAIAAGWSMSAGGHGVASSSPSAARNVVIVASGANPVGGRDPANRLIACTGPACPAGPLPQDAHIVATHAAYTTPLGGTRFIAPVPDGTVRPPPGYECCTTATFENEFSLPRDATSARISISVLADNQAIVAINGVEFGRHADGDATWNYGGPPATFSTIFPPDPSGTNRLHVTLWNEGAAVGVQYHAIVTHEAPVDPDVASDRADASASLTPR